MRMTGRSNRGLVVWVGGAMVHPHTSVRCSIEMGNGGVCCGRQGSGCHGCRFDSLVLGEQAGFPGSGLCGSV
ncbi:hypothetical protein BDZ85DRAFT_266125 [Elsinoe ampelina]|uniref:Uncharacterized protein n=1 Tax=Elsinoe ampelina TaxID=302913 RepID=A0A6A6G5N1_9PEZI|nr:hypothetical protein BDZ85DRAFT_266125 [Elsinoe ampelina]